MEHCLLLVMSNSFHGSPSFGVSETKALGSTSLGLSSSVSFIWVSSYKSSCDSFPSSCEPKPSLLNVISEASQAGIYLGTCWKTLSMTLAIASLSSPNSVSFSFPFTISSSTCMNGVKTSSLPILYRPCTISYGWKCCSLCSLLIFLHSLELLDLCLESSDAQRW